MILKEIEISGFKSFPVKSRMAFSFPIVAIVGPNGSGKSNVAEAFRFVLGEQSKKNLRSKSAEDLIWAGNEFRSRLNRARVSIVFDNKNRIFNIDFEELKIERVIYRDGVSEYYINDSQVRLKDVQEILASAKLGASSHHIISQGEADAMLNASDKERMQIIKDALGLNVYSLKLNEAKRKLKKTEENLKESQISIRELRPQLKFLEAQIEKKEKIDFLKEELARAYASYLHLEKQKLSKEKFTALSELAKLKEAYRLAKNAFDDFRLYKKDSDAKEKIQNTLSALEKQKNAIQEEVNYLISELSAKRAEMATLERIAKNEKKSADKEAPIMLAEGLLNRIIKLLSSILKGSTFDNTELEYLHRELLLVKEKSKAASVKKDYGAEIVSLKKDIKRLEAVAADKETELRNLRLEQSELRARLEKEGFDSERESKLLELSDRKSKALNAYRAQEAKILEIKRKEDELMSVLNEAKLYSAERFLLIYRELESGSAKLDKIYSRLEIEKIKIKLEELGDIDDDTIKQYKFVKEKMDFLQREMEDLSVSKQKTESVIEDLEGKLQEETRKGIRKISNEFNGFFKILFGGGKANIEYYVSEDQGGQQEEAVLVSLQIPGKKLSSLESLSGGERSLVSIALIFAISQVSPPPFIILDETDAALDEANSRKYSEILMQLARNSQIITITHNRQTMSVAGELYGVTMGKDAVSQVLSVSLKEAESVAK